MHLDCSVLTIYMYMAAFQFFRVYRFLLDTIRTTLTTDSWLIRVKFAIQQYYVLLLVYYQNLMKVFATLLQLLLVTCTMSYIHLTRLYILRCVYKHDDILIHLRTCSLWTKHWLCFHAWSVRKRWRRKSWHCKTIYRECSIFLLHRCFPNKSWICLLFYQLPDRVWSKWVYYTFSTTKCHRQNPLQRRMDSYSSRTWLNKILVKSS